MPGLVGIVWNNRVDAPLLHKMANSIKHEEWYKANIYSDSFFSAARVDLGIFNPEPQPIFNEDKTLCMFMYGKVYDYENKVSELKSRGHRFTVGNDAEYCLHSYEEYGKGFVKSLNGSFVLTIYDLKQRKVIVANDRYGLRPLYYAISGGKLLFASEVKAILEDKAFKGELNNEAIVDFFARGPIVGNKTFFKGIELLPPASVFTYDGRNISIEEYWDFNYEPDYNLSEDEIVDQLVETLTTAVDVRMRDNLRYGVALSGGLDSRSIVGAMNKDKRRDVVAITFGIKGCDEMKIAEIASRKANMRHISVEINPDEVVTPYSEDVVRITDGMDYIGVGHQLFAYRRVKPYVDVLFDGLEGDVLLTAVYPVPGVSKAKNDDDLARNIYASHRIFSDDMLARLFNDDYYAKVKDMPPQSVKSFLSRKIGHPVNKFDYFVLQTVVRRFNLLGNVVMRSVLEDITPLFDNNFIDVIIKIPRELRINHRIYRKFLMRLTPELAAIPYNQTMVPADAPLIAWRLGEMYQYGKGRLRKEIWRLTGGKIYLPDKRSYVNLDEWLRLNEKWKGFVKEILLNEKACYRSYLNQGYIETLISEHEAGKTDHSQRLCFLVSFELFLRMFVRD